MIILLSMKVHFSFRKLRQALNLLIPAKRQSSLQLAHKEEALLGHQVDLSLE